MSDQNSQRQRSAHAGPRHPAPPGPPEPSHAERARTLVQLGDLGTLSSQSKHRPGWPFGSLTPFAIDPRGQPLLLISAMAMHTQNLRLDPRASLLVSQSSEDRDPLGLGRVTLLAEAEEVAADDLAAVRASYLQAHPSASYWVDYADFAFYRLRVQQVYFVGGFGVMGWVDGDDYLSAQPDPLAESAARIVEHMNTDHGEGLRQIAEHQLTLTVEQANMTAVDRLGFHARLLCAGKPRGVRINFAQPVVDAAGARWELVEMVGQARAATGEG